MNYIIRRTEKFDIEKIPGWILIYGRRKVGKTFLVRNFIPHDKYYFVRRDLTIVSDGERLRYLDFLVQVAELLKSDATVVVDEFQRLPLNFMDEISLLHPRGRLILLGSSLRIVHRVFSPRSPLLGIVSTYRLDLLRPTDILVYLASRLGPGNAMEISPLMVEPWLLKYVDLFNGDVARLAYNIIEHNIYAIRSLVGEVFSEEERELTARYEAIISAVASGLWRVKEIAYVLFNKGLIERPDTGLVRQYIHNLVEIGLLESIPIANRREKYIKIKSPIIDLYYYLDDKYNIEEEGLPSFSEVKDTVRTRLGFHVQDFVGRLYSQIMEAKINIYLSSDLEIDFILTRRRKILAVAEVKWRSNISRRDLKTFASRTSSIPAKLKLFISKVPVEGWGEVVIKTPQELVEDAEGWIKGKYPDSDLCPTT